MSILGKLDAYYNSKKPNEVWLLVILFAVLIGYLLYIFISPISAKYRENEERKYNNLTMKIDSANSFLRNITVNGDVNYRVNSLNGDIVKKRVGLNTYRSKLKKLKGAMVKLSNVLYTKDNWSKFLHNIALKAKDNNLKVESITNTSLEQNSTFGKVLDVNIVSEGKYGDILAFMNDLEKTNLVSNITNVKLNATKSSPVVDINLSVWGIQP